jgi:hypothetical protein
MIAFYDGLTNKLFATVELVDGKLNIVGDEVIIKSLQGAQSDEDFVNNYGQYNNGYIRVFKVKAGRTAPKQLDIVQRRMPGNQVL